jgi:hypothetical protein
MFVNIWASVTEEPIASLRCAQQPCRSDDKADANSRHAFAAIQSRAKPSGIRLGNSRQLMDRKIFGVGPQHRLIWKCAGAANRTRTCDPVITNDVLYQLSYCGEPSRASGNRLKTLAPDNGQRPVLQEKRGL